LPLCYNAFWSSWPCIFNYSLDKDVSDHLSVNLPTLYKAGQRKFYFNMKNFWIWICQAIIHGGLIYFGTMYSLNNFLSNDGLTKDHWFRSTAAFSSIMHVINYKVFINIRHWNKVSFVVLFLSLAFYYLTLLILSIPGMAFSLNNELTHMLFQNFSYFKVWIVIICLPLIALLPDMTLNWIQLNFFPSPADIVAANPEAFEEYIKTRPLDKELELVNTGHKNGHGEIKNYSLEPSEYMNYRK
jgi:magnesium-transporting ATPase (P-type)